MTIEKILNIQPAIQRLIEMDLPAQKAYELVKVAKIIDRELQAFNETRNKLIEKYGEKTEDGNTKVKDENIEQFSKDIQEIIVNEIDVPEFKISISDLSEKIDAKTLLVLDDFIN